jgi:hypothetical protein
MNTKPNNRLLRPKAESLLVAVDVFCHEQQVLADVRDALAAGLKPVTFALIGDAVVLRLERNESPKPLQEE